MSTLGDAATGLRVQEIIDKGRQLKQSFEDVSQPRSDYQLKNFVVGNHQSPERQFLQIVIELQRKVSSIRRAQIGLRQLSTKYLEEPDLDERDLIDLDRGEAELAILGAIREFNCLYAMYEACPKFTHEQIQAAEQSYWEHRLARQAALDIEATGRIGVGNFDALRQADMLPNLSEKVRGCKKYYKLRTQEPNVHWFLRALEEFALFRRGIIVSQIVVNVYLINLSFEYIMYATGIGVAGTEIVAVVGAFHLPQGVLMGYLFRVYSQRKEQK